MMSSRTKGQPAVTSIQWYIYIRNKIEVYMSFKAGLIVIVIPLYMIEIVLLSS
jgi:hypothetical protein